MVMKAAADGSFCFKMIESWFETHNDSFFFFKGICITFFIHFQCVQIIRMGYTLFFNSVSTRIKFVLNLLLNNVFILEKSSHSLTVSVPSSL